jgi:excisionase family DNA binding protein
VSTAPVAFGPPDDHRQWVQVANGIAARLADGTYPDGQWLPPAARIIEELGLYTSQGTGALALAEVRNKGLITKVPGTGYYAGNGPRPATGPAPARPERQPRPATPARPQLPAILTQDYLTVDELRLMLRISKMTAYRLIWEGQIEGAMQVGRTIRIPASGAAKYLASCVITGHQGDFDEFTRTGPDDD